MHTKYFLRIYGHPIGKTGPIDYYFNRTLTIPGENHSFEAIKNAAIGQVAENVCKLQVVAAEVIDEDQCS